MKLLLVRTPTPAKLRLLGNLQVQDAVVCSHGEVIGRSLPALRLADLSAVTRR